MSEQTLRTIRQAQGRSLRSVAREATVDPSWLSRIERGLCDPPASTLRRICRVLGLAKAEEILALVSPEKGGDADTKRDA